MIPLASNRPPPLFAWGPPKGALLRRLMSSGDTNNLSLEEGAVIKTEE